MKKIFLLLVVAFITLPSIAQNATVNWGENPEMIKFSKLSFTKNIGSNEKGYYLLSRRPASEGKGNGDYIDFYDFEHKLKFSKEIKCNLGGGKTRFELQTVEILKKNIVVFGFTFDSKTRNSNLYFSSYSFDLNLESDWKEIDQKKFDAKEYFIKYQVRISANKEHVAICHSIYEEKQNGAKLALKVFNADFKPEWEKEVILFDSTGYFYRQIEIDDQANLVILGGKLIKARKMFSGIPNGIYKAFQFKLGTDEINIAAINTEQLPIAEIKFKLDKNNKLIVAGLYSSNNDKFQTGSFYQRFDRDKLNLEVSKTLELDWNLVSKNFEGIKEDNYKGLSDFNLDEIIIKEDGSAVIIAQQVIVESKSSGNQDPRYSANFNKYYHNDIMIINLNSNGSLNWINIVPKRQETLEGNSIYASYIFGSANNKLYFFFNDNMKNFDEKRGDKRYVMKNISETVVNCTIIDKDGQMATEMLFDPKNVPGGKRMFSTELCQQISKDKILFYNYLDVKYKMGIIQLQ